MCEYMSTLDTQTQIRMAAMQPSHPTFRRAKLLNHQMTHNWRPIHNAANVKPQNMHTETQKPLNLSTTTTSRRGINSVLA